MKIGLSQIHSGRRQYMLDFWKKFFCIIQLDYMISNLEIMEAYEKGKKILGTESNYCFFRCIDIGQHIDLIENGCDHIILFSIRSKLKCSCDAENYTAEFLSLHYPNLNFYNFFFHIDNPSLRKKELRKLGQFFTSDENKLYLLEQLGSLKFYDKNNYFINNVKNRINIFIINDMYCFLNPRMESSIYVDFLQSKLKCNILTPEDFLPLNNSNKKQYRDLLRKRMPKLNGKFQRYFCSEKKINLIKILKENKTQIDGVLLVSDLWCSTFREERSFFLSILNEFDIPYYDLLFSIDSLSTIETILESFVENLYEIKYQEIS